LRQAEFQVQLTQLLNTPVEGLERAAQLASARALLENLVAARESRQPICAFVPFLRGRRPGDEVSSPGLGASEDVGLILGSDTEQDSLYLLFRVEGLEGLSEEAVLDLALELELAFVDADGHATRLPHWAGVPLLPSRLVKQAGRLETQEVGLAASAGCTLAIRLDLTALCLPGTTWSWEDFDADFRAKATETDPFSFGHAFHQKLEASLRLKRQGVVISAATTEVEIVDARRMGSLYQRVLERIVVVDTARQAKQHGVAEVSPKFHPWYPVLKIGSYKAELYMEALIADIAGSGRFFSNPRWLLEVGLYLELLTCIGIFEAVKDDLGDVLSEAERHALEHNVALRAVREKLDVNAWRAVWKTRPIAFDGPRMPHLGQEQARNLLRKRQTTLAFLHAHHEDLKQAIALAGPNPYNAQESWHRVFRDAERAVLHQVGAAFPELDVVPERVRHWALWLRKGDKAALGALTKPLLSLLGEEDGLFATACNQYRASMNEVAVWAQRRGLMDFTGDECVPREVSLLHAQMDGNVGRVARLQRHDGYAAALEGRQAIQDATTHTPAALEASIRRVALFAPLTPEERTHLCASLRSISLGPLERILIEGSPGSSLFLVAEGQLDVLQRRGDTDVSIATLGPGSVFGELSLLTGAPRSATVRAVDGAVVWEIGQANLRPLVAARPKLADAFAELVAARASTANKPQVETPKSLGARIRQWLL
jgi:hypothetical protein